MRLFLIFIFNFDLEGFSGCCGERGALRRVFVGGRVLLCVDPRAVVVLLGGEVGAVP